MENHITADKLLGFGLRPAPCECGQAVFAISVSRYSITDAICKDAFGPLRKGHTQYFPPGFLKTRSRGVLFSRFGAR
jgi:hypothetical protein